MTATDEAIDIRETCEIDGWRSMVVVRSKDGYDARIELLLYVRDPDGFRTSRVELDDVPGGFDPAAWREWAARRCRAAVFEFFLGRDHPLAQVGDRPASIPGPPLRGDQIDRMLASGFPDELLAGIDPTVGCEGDRFAACLAPHHRPEHPRYAYLVARESRDYARAFVSHRPWTSAVGSLEQLVEGMIRKEIPADCSAERLSKAMLDLKGFNRYLRHASVRAIRAVDAFHVRTIPSGGTSGLSPALTLDFLSKIPPSWVPEDEPSYVAASSVGHVAYRMWSHNRSATWLRRLLADCRGRWVEYLERLEGLPASANGLEQAFSDIDDMILDVSDRIVAPVLTMAGVEGVVSKSRSVATAMLCDDVGLATVLGRSHRWHSMHSALPGLTAPVGPWQALAPDFAVDDGVEIVFLANAEALSEEGREMEHCVGSYVESCASGRTNVASVRRISTKERLSTIEVVSGEEGPRIVQHRGRSNGMPPAEAGAAVEAWTRSVADGTVAAFRDPVVRSEDRGICLPEVGTPADWRGILPPRCVRMTWQELADEIVGKPVDLSGA